MNIKQRLLGILNIPPSATIIDYPSIKVISDLNSILLEIHNQYPEICTYDCYIQIINHYPEIGRKWVYNPNQKYRINQIAFYTNPRCGGWFTVIQIIDEQNIIAMFEKWGKRQLKQQQNIEIYNDFSIQKSLANIHNRPIHMVQPISLPPGKKKASIPEWLIRNNRSPNGRVLYDPIEYKYNECDPDADWDDFDDDDDLYIMEPDEVEDYLGENDIDF